MLKLPPVDKIAKYYQTPGGKRSEFVKINNTVHIFVKDTIIEVSGAVLARRSKILEEKIVAISERMPEKCVFSQVQNVMLQKHCGWR